MDYKIRINFGRFRLQMEPGYLFLAWGRWEYERLRA